MSPAEKADILSHLESQPRCKPMAERVRDGEKKSSLEPDHS